MTSVTSQCPNIPCPGTSDDDAASSGDKTDSLPSSSDTTLGESLPPVCTDLMSNAEDQDPAVRHHLDPTEGHLAVELPESRYMYHLAFVSSLSPQLDKSRSDADDHVADGSEITCQNEAVFMSAKDTKPNTTEAAVRAPSDVDTANNIVSRMIDTDSSECKLSSTGVEEKASGCDWDGNPSDVGDEDNVRDRGATGVSRVIPVTTIQHASTDRNVNIATSTIRQDGVSDKDPSEDKDSCLSTVESTSSDDILVLVNFRITADRYEGSSMASETRESVTRMIVRQSDVLPKTEHTCSSLSDWEDMCSTENRQFYLVQKKKTDIALSGESFTVSDADSGSSSQTNWHSIGDATSMAANRLRRFADRSVTKTTKVVKHVIVTKTETTESGDDAAQYGSRDDYTEIRGATGMTEDDDRHKTTWLSEIVRQSSFGTEDTGDSYSADVGYMSVGESHDHEDAGDSFSSGWEEMETVSDMVVVDTTLMVSDDDETVESTEMEQKIELRTDSVIDSLAAGYAADDGAVTELDVSERCSAQVDVISNETYDTAVAEHIETYVEPQLADSTQGESVTEAGENESCTVCPVTIYDETDPVLGTAVTAERIQTRVSITDNATVAEVRQVTKADDVETVSPEIVSRVDSGVKSDRVEFCVEARTADEAEHLATFNDVEICKLDFTVIDERCVDMCTAVKSHGIETHANETITDGAAEWDFVGNISADESEVYVNSTYCASEARNAVFVNTVRFQTDREVIVSSAGSADAGMNEIVHDSGMPKEVETGDIRMMSEVHTETLDGGRNYVSRGTRSAECQTDSYLADLGQLQQKVDSTSVGMQTVFPHVDAETGTAESVNEAEDGSDRQPSACSRMFNERDVKLTQTEEDRSDTRISDQEVVNRVDLLSIAVQTDHVDLLSLSTVETQTSSRESTNELITADAQTLITVDVAVGETQTLSDKDGGVSTLEAQTSTSSLDLMGIDTETREHKGGTLTAEAETCTTPVGISAVAETQTLPYESVISTAEAQTSTVTVGLVTADTQTVEHRADTLSVEAETCTTPVQLAVIETQTSMDQVDTSTAETQTSAISVDLVTTDSQTVDHRADIAMVEAETCTTPVDVAVVETQTIEAERKEDTSTSEAQTDTTTVDLVLTGTQTIEHRIDTITIERDACTTPVQTEVAETQTSVDQVDISTAETQTSPVSVDLVTTESQTVDHRADVAMVEAETCTTPVDTTIVETQTLPHKEDMSTSEAQTDTTTLDLVLTGTQTIEHRIDTITIERDACTTPVQTEVAETQTSVDQVDISTAEAQTSTMSVDLVTTDSQTVDHRAEIVMVEAETCTTPVDISVVETQTLPDKEDMSSSEAQTDTTTVNLVLTGTQTIEHRIDTITIERDACTTPVQTEIAETQTSVDQVDISTAEAQTSTVSVDLVTTDSQTVDHRADVEMVEAETCTTPVDTAIVQTQSLPHKEDTSTSEAQTDTTTVDLVFTGTQTIEHRVDTVTIETESCTSPVQTEVAETQTSQDQVDTSTAEAQTSVTPVDLMMVATQTGWTDDEDDDDYSIRLPTPDTDTVPQIDQQHIDTTRHDSETVLDVTSQFENESEVSDSSSESVYLEDYSSSTETLYTDAKEDFQDTLDGDNTDVDEVDDGTSNASDDKPSMLSDSEYADAISGNVDVQDRDSYLDQRFGDVAYLVDVAEVEVFDPGDAPTSDVPSSAHVVMDLEPVGPDAGMDVMSTENEVSSVASGCSDRVDVKVTSLLVLLLHCFVYFVLLSHFVRTTLGQKTFGDCWNFMVFPSLSSYQQRKRNEKCSCSTDF